MARSRKTLSTIITSIYRYFLPFALLIFGFQNIALSTVISDSFESGSIGEIEQLDDTQWNLWIENDSEEPWLDDIPKWRNWWYVKLNEATTDHSITINIMDSYPLDNLGWEYHYAPVYSYDKKNWIRFSSTEVTQSFSDDDELQERTHQLSITKKFTNKAVWLARFFPYTTNDLDHFLDSLKENKPWVHALGALEEENLGLSPYYQKNVKLLTLSYPFIPDLTKKRIWIHARSHPAENGGSFVLEGLIDFLTDLLDENAQRAMSHLIFNIVSIHNVDGVIDGNYRTNMDTQNLESMWFHYPESPYELTEDAPFENKLLNEKMRQLNSLGPVFEMGLNLHSSQSTADYRTFFYPHFGTVDQGYTEQEAKLWNEHVAFIDQFSDFLGTYDGHNLVEPTVDEGGSGFLNYFFPETWWWNNFNESVLALTMETTYDKAGYGERRITPDDLRKQGHALGLAIIRHFGLEVTNPPIFYPDNVSIAPLLQGRSTNKRNVEINDVDDLRKRELENRL
jgi:Cytosolic carboxypeptidase N-terminal domain